MAPLLNITGFFLSWFQLRCPPLVCLLICSSVRGLTAGPEPLSRTAVRAGLGAGVTGAAGGTGTSTAAVTGWPGN